jgi:hypothetical protein
MDSQYTYVVEKFDEYLQPTVIARHKTVPPSPYRLECYRKMDRKELQRILDVDFEEQAKLENLYYEAENRRRQGMIQKERERLQKEKAEREKKEREELEKKEQLKQEIERREKEEEMRRNPTPSKKKTTPEDILSMPLVAIVAFYSQTPRAFCYTILAVFFILMAGFPALRSWILGSLWEAICRSQADVIIENTATPV